MSGPDVFLSYNRKDIDVARPIAEALETEGLSVWWDQALRSGDAYDEVTEQALRSARAVVVLWSKRSVASRWVRTEATIADRNKTLVPAMIEPCERPIMFELTQSAELCDWSGDTGDPAWRAFVADVKAMVGARRSGVTPDVLTTRRTKPDAIVRESHAIEDRPSLAILPFRNRSRIEDDEIFADGMVEDIVAALAQGANVKVLASMATAHLKDAAATDIAKIGQQLNVRYLLEGNVRRAGTAFQVTTQLIEASSGHVVWSGRFARSLSELADLQEELTLEVAVALDAKVSTIEMEQALRKPGNLTAWEAVLRSQAMFRHIDSETLERSVLEARQAVEIAPEYGLGHATLASALAVHYMFEVPDNEELVDEIRSAIDRALEFDHGSSRVLGQVAQAYCLSGFPDEGLIRARQAIEKAPNDGYAHYILAMASSMLNRYEDAIEHCEIAASFMPGVFTVFYVKAWHANALIRSGRWAEGEDVYDECLTIGPDFAIGQYHKAMFCWRDGRREQGRAIVRKLRQ
uniref:TIR domain-containing protein n=1 Tax=Parerythrobacter lutipelagi TaxID=1964208 RepID=UPI0010F560DD|nr:TIR domain-containing protein [Parerythrobacter lutipelagi]